MLMRAVIAATLAAALVGLVAGSPVTSAAVRNAGVAFTNVVASTPFTGGGYPVPPGSRVPVAGTCGAGPFNANQSESWIAVKPGTEDLVGSSKFFFDKYSTFYMFYMGSYRILNGAPVDDNQVQGYDCISTGTQEMPPSWTNVTDPNVQLGGIACVPVEMQSRSEEHTSELQSQSNLVCRLLLEKKKLT